MTQGTPSARWRIFLLVWLGELVSVIGSGLTTFGVGIWIYDRTGSATQYALIYFFASIPQILVSPLVGVVVDRWDRRLVMLLSDSGAGLGTLLIVILLALGHLNVWHIYLAVTLSAAFSAFQWPAYSAATTLLVPPKDYARASGMVDIGYGLSQLVAPAAAGALMLVGGLKPVVILDFATFLFAVSILSAVRFPQPKPSADGQAARGSLRHEMLYGWSYIIARPGLLTLLLFFTIFNFLTGVLIALAVPMMLAFASSATIGIMMSVGAVAGLAGSVMMSVWGGPRRRVHGVLGFTLLLGVGCILVGLRPSVLPVTGALLLMFFCLTPINACSQSIWQSKVAPDIQGRVFSVRSALAFAALPLAYLTAGPLADYVFEPLLKPEGALAGSIGRIIGVGEGRGIALIFILMGVLVMLMALGGYFYPRLRQLEDELPDAVPAEQALTAPESL